MYHFSIELENVNSCTWGITNWEVKDGFFGAPLADMTPDQAEDARDLLIRKLSRVVLYTTDLPAADYAAFVRFFRNAHIIGAENVKLSWLSVAGVSDAQLQKIIAIGASFSIGVLFEPEAEHMDELGLERYGVLRSDNTGLVYNPNEFLKAGIRPYTNVLSKTKFAPDIRFLRVRDMNGQTFAPAALKKGNSEIKECASKLLTRTYRGYFSFGAYSDQIPVEQVIRDFAETLCAM